MAIFIDGPNSPRTRKITNVGVNHVPVRRYAATTASHPLALAVESDSVSVSFCFGVLDASLPAVGGLDRIHLELRNVPHHGQPDPPRLAQEIEIGAIVVKLDEGYTGGLERVYEVRHLFWCLGLRDSVADLRAQPPRARPDTRAGGDLALPPAKGVGAVLESLHHFPDAGHAMSDETRVGIGISIAASEARPQGTFVSPGRGRGRPRGRGRSALPRPCSAAWRLVLIID